MTDKTINRRLFTAKNERSRLPPFIHSLLYIAGITRAFLPRM